MRLLRNKHTGKIVEWTPECGRMDNLEPLPVSDYPEHLKPKVSAASPKKKAAKKKAAKKPKEDAVLAALPEVSIDDLSSGGLNGSDDS